MHTSVSISISGFFLILKLKIEKNSIIKHHCLSKSQNEVFKSNTLVFECIYRYKNYKNIKKFVTFHAQFTQQQLNQHS